MEGPDRERREQQEDDVGYPFPRPAGTMCRAERREDHRSDRKEVCREEERKAREIIDFVGRAPERLLQCRVPASPKRPPEGGQAPNSDEAPHSPRSSPDEEYAADQREQIHRGKDGHVRR